jgi:hypothetical protein
MGMTSLQKRKKGAPVRADGGGGGGGGGGKGFRNEKGCAYARRIRATGVRAGGLCDFQS